MKSFGQIIDKLYRKTILLKARADGTFDVMDITGEASSVLLKREGVEDGVTVELKPTKIYKINGLKRVSKICIQEFNGTQLVDLFGGDHSTMTETTLMNIIDSSITAGKYMSEGGGADAEKMRKQMSLILICSVLSVLGVIALIYMKAQGI